MAIRGFLLDLDGTLIDSNDAHLEAWMVSFAEHGYPVERAQVAAGIGKGGDQLVPDLLGKEADERDGDSLRKQQKKVFGKLAKERGLAVAPGAVELIAELGRRQIKTALATSSGDDQLDVAEETSGVKWRQLVDKVVGASDVENSKPAPDIIHAALKKLDLDGSECALLGDTPWDAESAIKGGIAIIAVTYGGNDVATLKKAGAVKVYRDAADVLAHLDQALALSDDK